MNQLLKNLLIIACAFFISLLVGSALALWVAGFFDTGTRSYYLAESVIQAIVAFIGTAIVSAWLISRRPLSFLGLTQKCSWKSFAGVIIVYVLALPALNQLIWWNQNITLPDSMHEIELTLRAWESQAAGVTDILLSSTSVGSLISGILLIGCLTGLAEEMLFRGTIQRTLESYKELGQWAIWLSAFFFSFVHMQFFGFFPRLLMGAFFGYLLYSSGSLWPGVFAHALNNSMVVVCSWLAVKYPATCTGFESVGVAESGFPWIAFLSLVFTTTFLYKGYNYFFGPLRK